MPIIYDSFETCEISVNLIGVLDYLICIPRPLAWGVLRSKTLQRYNKSLKYTNYSAFFCIFAPYRTFGVPPRDLRAQRYYKKMKGAKV